MAAQLASRTESLTVSQAAVLDALGSALKTMALTETWNVNAGGQPNGSVRLAVLQALRQVTTYRMADKVLARFERKMGNETLSTAFIFAHIGRAAK